MVQEEPVSEQGYERRGTGRECPHCAVDRARISTARRAQATAFRTQSGTRFDERSSWPRRGRSGGGGTAQVSLTSRAEANGWRYAKNSSRPKRMLNTQ